eukprot:TRINITY_DN4683_c0_g1_i9.p1 TRINITY_DN4683_c0_g1~~TRINITY_DN4683_c0_g1_i9.p1  ORF type:complete len:328 (-),score=144.99 TRINITY_DN4683_c0_g1_i9:51-1034(-)
MCIRDSSGVLFKTHKELTLNYVSILYNKILSNVLAPGLSDKMHKFGIYLIDDMIEHLGIELIPNEWPHLSEALIRFATDKNCAVRQACAYGIGMLAEKSKEAFGMMADICLKTLEQAMLIPQGAENDKVYGLCKDNIVASFGRIIRAQSDKINLVQVCNFWVNNLPIQYDADEALSQHALLTDIIGLKPELVLGEQGQNMTKVCSIFGDIVDTKYCSDATKEAIKKILLGWLSADPLKTLVHNAVNGLGENQKKRLQKLLAQSASISLCLSPSVSIILKQSLSLPLSCPQGILYILSLIHISEPTRRTPISYAVFCLKKKKNRHAIL